ncbi:MAG: rod shape-determining protein MreC [Bdellovibrionota bacterium]
MNRKLKTFLKILVFVYFLVCLVSFRVKKHSTNRWYETAIVTVSAPVQYVVTTGYDKATWIIRHYLFLVQTSKFNDQLMDERSVLRSKLIYLQETELENQRLRELLNLQSSMALNLQVAKVIAKGVSPFEHVIRIYKGSDQGLQSGYPVIKTEGVVGQIFQVYPGYSDVALLIDKISAIDVVVQRSRARGILKGDRINQLKFEFLPRDRDVQVGDVVISSGMDKVFPKGIPVGEVTAVGERGKNLFLQATVKPFVDFSRLEEVAVVLPQEGTQP